jgi:hypothetical protein
VASSPFAIANADICRVPLTLARPKDPKGRTGRTRGAGSSRTSGNVFLSSTNTSAFRSAPLVSTTPSSSYHRTIRRCGTRRGANVAQM